MTFSVTVDFREGDRIKRQIRNVADERRRLFTQHLGDLIVMFLRTTPRIPSKGRGVNRDNFGWMKGQWYYNIRADGTISVLNDATGSNRPGRSRGRQRYWRYWDAYKGTGFVRRLVDRRMASFVKQAAAMAAQGRRPRRITRKPSRKVVT